MLYVYVCLGDKYLLVLLNRFIISAAPLTSSLSTMFTIPFFGQFYKSTDNSHIWSKIFYYHISGYGPPSLLITKGKQGHTIYGHC